MDLFEELRELLLQQRSEGNLPTWLMVNAVAIATDPKRYADKAGLVETLITQIRNFDPHAGIGCFDTSVSAETIETTIRQIMLR
jgi:hypothetical protein